MLFYFALPARKPYDRGQHPNMGDKKRSGTWAGSLAGISFSSHVRKTLTALKRFSCGLLATKAPAPPRGVIPHSEEKGLFEYMPLDPGGIRVLHLLPGRPGDAIQLVVRHEQFSHYNVPQYSALSYTWGGMAETYDVAIRNHRCPDPPRRLPITGNLFVALNGLRSPTEPLALWVDAVCVNQRDLDERGVHVARMDQIYLRAERVVVWLGPEADDSGVAIRAMDRVGEVLEVDWQTRNITPSPGAETYDEEAEKFSALGPAFSPGQLRAVSSLLQRRWFTRLWIRQEIGLARKETAVLVCGPDTVRWETFEKAGWLLYSDRFRRTEPVSKEDLKELAAGAGLLVDVSNGGRPGVTLGHAFSLCRKAECEDPRDRIYANLSLINDAEREALGVVPDYKASTVEVYRRFAERALEVTGGGLLRYCVTPAKLKGLPSWVPDWTARQTPVWFSALPSASIRGGAPVCVGERLQCVGGFCGALLEVLPPLDLDRLDDGQLIDRLREICDSCPGNYGTLRDRAEAFWGVLGARDFAELRIPPRGYNLSLETCIRSLNPAETGYSASTLRSFLGIYTAHRRIAFTQENRVCLVPDTAEPGNEVWDLLGVGALMVLRRVGDAEYEVVGEAWVDGYYNNEALLGALDVGFETVRVLPEGGRVSVPAVRERASGDVKLADPRLERLCGRERRAAESLEDARELMDAVTPELLRRAGIELTEVTLI